ncbi:serine O-acetyltransferase [Loigolactobacillus bifermentans]|uniref:Serine acetyltransferase n=1 Tax=Loigolactobacillus bifermentans DSM 20003 TaxID=1423726 RepID=A0A0R1GL27_9LACO|nr:serine acetyltransferase [Loigolactobacillus bifermentans]KRK33155.1 hypothetical protein FC07_GL001409 [Loigolactobacillus bifermentans DSM 20003]QGG60507.1 serine acetyltransferase [Loigolactobacillus bifermentans]
MSNFKILLQQNCFATDPEQRQKAAQALEQQYNCEINCVALAPDVQFAHHGRGCTIAAAKIDQHVTIFQNVTLGSNQRFNRQTQQWEHLGGPVIGNDVVIADGAKVLGPVMIGAHTVIGAGAIITKNVPANSVAYGVNQIKPRDPNYDLVFHTPLPDQQAILTACQHLIDVYETSKTTNA